MLDPQKIRPIPFSHGVGFTSVEPLEVDPRYHFEKIGVYYNYYVTPELWTWPFPATEPSPMTIDGFSPNLNKSLHIGHLRNLAVAKSLYEMFHSSKFVSMLGTSFGEKDGALEDLKKWFDFVGYHPEIYKDVDFTLQDSLFSRGDGDYSGCLIWRGPNGPIVVKRSLDHPDKPNEYTYSYHELAFNYHISPDYILTGSEQKSHFEDLGFEHKYLAMGLVLDAETGGKLKSREGSSLLAQDVLDLVVSKLSPTKEPVKLAWNILAWNFLRSRREKDIKFAVDNWISPESPGMYISYLAARLFSALKNAGIDSPPENYELTYKDVNLLGYADCYEYWLQRSMDKMDVSPLASFAQDLAQRLTAAYNDERIVGGRPGFQFSIFYAYKILGKIMKILGMFVLEQV